MIAASLLLTLYNKHNDDGAEQHDIYDMIDAVCLILQGLAPFSRLAQRGAALLDALRPRGSAEHRQFGTADDGQGYTASETVDQRMALGASNKQSQGPANLDQTLLTLPLDFRDEGWTFTTDDAQLDNGNYDLSGLLFSDNDLQNVFETDLDWGATDLFHRS